ncbi:MAG: EAL domain-containing protein [Clostridia bacterium]|nr:EAL domain-containing protein [Clostridia bacterium]
MKKLISILLLTLLLLTAAAPLVQKASAAERKVVRVGWYESAYHRTDQYGRRSGYGYEYQQRIATYTGWIYEYVEGSWSELFEMLVAGQIDILSDVSYTEARAELILYSAEEMGSEDYHAFISPTNSEISPDDFTTFNGKKVGVNKNSIQEELLIEWAKTHSVTPEIVELSGKSPELLEMLARGEIDVLVTLDAYGATADVLSVCKIGSAYSYFGINKNRPDLKRDLDGAMNRIFENNRNFNEQLAEKYLQTRGVSNFLTPDEKEWLNGHGAIRVGYRNDFLPFCAEDESTNELIGALTDYLKYAENCEKNAKLTFETQGFDTMDNALNALRTGEIDVLFPVNIASYDGEKLGVIITDTLISTEVYASVRSSDQRGISPDEPMTVAIVEGHRNHTTFVKDFFPDWSIRYFKNTDACFKAVANGEADCTLTSNYRLNRISDICDRLKLSNLTTGHAMDLSFAVSRENDELYSILNKINRQIPSALVNASLTGSTFLDDRVTFGDFLHDNLAAFIGVAAAIIILILLLIILNFRSIIKANEGMQIISETEHDNLTALYTRGFFILYAHRMFKENPSKKMDAIVLNVEKLHMLNTLNGRSFGDDVIRALGEEIRVFLKDADGIAGRMEGDHFDIYCAHRDDYDKLLDRFQDRMNEVSKNSEIILRMGVMPWQKGMLPDQMFERAWMACDLVRGDFKKHLMVYDEELKNREELNSRLRNDLMRALGEHELEVYYQPKYNIKTEHPTLESAEALIRWNHPELGMINPPDFISLLEDSGQISTLDKYVREEAAKQVAAWRDMLGYTLPVSVNLSRVDVFDPDLLRTMDALINKYGLERRDIKLEVTESAYTENADHLIRIIGELREKGYEIEMDDFGTGYSSLNMLSSMPIDVLKMDIGFIRNIDRNEKDLRLVKLILDIAKNLKVLVVAEGVETEIQLKLLKEAGCDIVQGYYFSRPLPAAEFEKTILGKKAGR